MTLPVTLAQNTQDHNFPGIVTPDGRPVHLDRADGSSVEDHQTAVLDLALLARSRCLVTSPSGFSHHSWLAGGGKACQRMFFDCGNLAGGPGGGCVPGVAWAVGVCELLIINSGVPHGACPG